MPVKTIAVLKTYFETGDRPTESQFADLIDSFIHKQTGSVITAKSYDAGTRVFSLSFSDNTTISFEVPSQTDVTNILNRLDQIDIDLDGKVDKVVGKGLSTNDFTNEDKTKLDGLQNYVKPASEPISYIDGLQAILDLLALDSEVVKSVNGITPDAQGNVNTSGGDGVYNLSNSQTKLNYSYFGAQVYGILLQIPTETSPNVYDWAHNLDIDTLLKLEQWTDGIVNNPTTQTRQDLIGLVASNTDINFDANTLNISNYTFPAGTFVYLEYTINEILTEGIGTDAVGTSAIGVDPV